MTINNHFEQVTVLGAAGKMGRGIALLLAWEMVRLNRCPENQTKTYRLHLIDVRQKGLDDLREYIHTQSAKQGARKIDAVRSLYRSCDEVQTDEQVRQAFVADTLALIRTSTDFRQAKSSQLVFEAVPEAEPVKIETLRKVNEICPGRPFFLSNTSSIPISVLDREAGLDGRIIGFHFYNPPAVQRLVELIPAQTTRPELVDIAHEIARRLGKTAVPSRDIAGFIGNGHFVREALHAIREVERLCDDGRSVERAFDRSEAIYALNKVSQDGLLRPMGIFQLIDYVGIDVFASILQIMNRHIDGETLGADLIDRLIEMNVLGGQRPDGSQKNGCFQYAGRDPVSVFMPDRGEYEPLQHKAIARIDRVLGQLSTVGWRDLLTDAARDRKLKDHFARLASLDTLGMQLTIAYLRASRRIAEKLLSDGVAESPDDVNTVLVNGFGHLYGPFGGVDIS